MHGLWNQITFGKRTHSSNVPESEEQFKESSSPKWEWRFSRNSDSSIRLIDLPKGIWHCVNCKKSFNLKGLFVCVFWSLKIQFSMLLLDSFHTVILIEGQWMNSSTSIGNSPTKKRSVVLWLRGCPALSCPSADIASWAAIGDLLTVI